MPRTVQPIKPSFFQCANDKSRDYAHYSAKVVHIRTLWVAESGDVSVGDGGRKS